MTTGVYKIMKIGQKRMIQEQIEKVVNMRLSGMSFSEIGRIVGKDRTTIMYHYKKYVSPDSSSIKIRRPDLWEINIHNLKQPSKSEYDEHINRGKNYVDYLAEEESRNWKNRTDIADNGISGYPQVVDKLKKV